MRYLLDTNIIIEAVAGSQSAVEALHHTTMSEWVWGDGERASRIGESWIRAHFTLRTPRTKSWTGGMCLSYIQGHQKVLGHGRLLNR
jgi:hypothetical protein